MSHFFPFLPLAFLLLLLYSIILVLIVWRRERQRRLKKYVKSKIGEFARAELRPRRVVQILDKLSDKQLLNAMHHPDHQAEVKSMIQKHLVGKGLGENEFQQDQLPLEDYRVESFLSPMSMESAKTLPIRRSQMYRVLHFLYFQCPLVALIIVLLFGKVPAFKSTYPDASPILEVTALLGSILAIPLLYYLFALFFWYSPFALPRLAMLSIYMPRPARILLLRPFNNGMLANRLRRFSKHTLSVYGHVFTLQDTHLREKPAWLHYSVLLLLLPVSLILPIAPAVLLTNFRYRLKSESRFIRLREKLSRIYYLNAVWAISSDRIFKVECSDLWWKRCVELFFASSDVIVMDVSELRPGSRWELDNIISRGLKDSVVFVASDVSGSDAATTFEGYWPISEVPKIHYYDESGHIKSEVEFQNSIALALACPSRAPIAAIHVPSPLRKLAAVTIAIGCSLLPFFILATGHLEDSDSQQERTLSYPWTKLGDNSDNPIDSTVSDVSQPVHEQQFIAPGSKPDSDTDITTLALYSGNLVPYQLRLASDWTLSTEDNFDTIFYFTNDEAALGVTVEKDAVDVLPETRMDAIEYMDNIISLIGNASSQQLVIALREQRFIGGQRWEFLRVEAHMEGAPLVYSIVTCVKENYIYAIYGWTVKPETLTPIVETAMDSFAFPAD